MSLQTGSLSPVREHHEQENPDRLRGATGGGLVSSNVGQAVMGPLISGLEREEHNTAASSVEEVGSGGHNSHTLRATGLGIESISDGVNGYTPVSIVTKERRGMDASAGSVPNEDANRQQVSMLPSPVSPDTSLPVSPVLGNDPKLRRLSTDGQIRSPRPQTLHGNGIHSPTPRSPELSQHVDTDGPDRRRRQLTIDTSGQGRQDVASPRHRPSSIQRAQSTPAPPRSANTARRSSDKDRTASGPAESEKPRPERMKLKTTFEGGLPMASPMPKSIPLPPVSLPTYLQLELSSQRPSHQYIYRSANSDFPYESSRVKIERLLNFLYLPFHLEGVLWFGMLACLDSWLYIFTILPLRLMKSIYILIQSWAVNFVTELQSLASFVYSGSFRVWRRRAQSSNFRKSSTGGPPTRLANGDVQHASHQQKRNRHHRRMKSVPSNLMPDDKADILKGLLILFTCLILLRFDASRMYHWIRGQSAIKLYVIYNVLEVCDRLFSALGQDVLECLFSREALERKPDGHSKVLRPFWLFMLALVYTIVHSTALFYQVITLNVAVNAYSNALITLLLSNQFVEIKSTVFKKFEKENLFQLTCADVVERFQLWHMLIIIAARNIAETGSMVLPSSAAASVFSKTNAAQAALGTNITAAASAATASFPSPRSMSSIVPLSFTLVPDLIASLTSYVPRISHVMGPFVIVLGSEMFVDWLKHAYVNKFNNTRPVIYDRFLDVLAKDYYTNAFGDQNLTKRLGLPVIPLSCLLIRASVQTYQMFVASWMPDLPSSASSATTATLASIHEQYTSSLGASPVSTGAALAQKMDELLGGYPSAIARSNITTYLNALLIALIIFLVALAAKLVLGMILLAFARNRYRSMKEREREAAASSSSTYHIEGGRRVGGWGVVEVDEDKRRWIYDGDEEGLKALREREEREKAKREREKERGISVESFEGVKRYEMVAKRIW